MGWSAPYFRALTSKFTVVLFDCRGNGLSDPAAEVDLDLLVEDLRAVLDDAGLGRVNLYGQGFGSPVAIAYAARNPDRVDRLLLYCAYAYGRGTVITDQFIDTMRKMPQAAAAFMVRETYPDDEELPTRMFLLESMHTPPETAVKYFEYARTVDVTQELGAVRAPTLVMQPERNPQVRAALGRDVASGIPGAELRSIEGGAYNPYARKSFEPTLQAIGDFVGVELIHVSRPILLLLTDMVDSTAMTQRVGESVSRELHELHDEIVRRSIGPHNGAFVQHTGDGMMVAFETAADALACAVAIQRGVSERNREASEPLEVRIGVALGEAYVHNGQPFAASAQLVTRVTGQGGSGEILTSEPVGDLASEAGFSFGNARTVELKGFPERARISEVLWSEF
jgi:class 3 adenylate cyclase/pimeloyl-ACP methyl ester carboxylesterase